MSPDNAKLGRRGEALIKGIETLRLEAYLPTTDDVPTIGWGSTHGVKLGMKITVEEAQARFVTDTADAVRDVIALTCPLSESMADALISLVYNAGPGTISPTSTIGAALRKRDYFAAWAGFALWRKQAGKDLRGLARRRGLEMALFMEDPFPK